MFRKHYKSQKAAGTFSSFFDRNLYGDKMSQSEIATLAGGCFWCIEGIFQQLKGVLKVTSGYTGGFVKNPTYKAVCSDTTGHAEAVQIEYDPDVITYEDLLRIFFTVHDPTTKDRQGNDVGASYRSAVYYHDEDQHKTVEKVIDEITQLKLWRDPIVTEIEPMAEFYLAEDYHQEYFKNNPGNPYCKYVIEPKLLKFRNQYLHRLK
jgi:peptide-methionine (S)-S-oxide reductase